MDDRAKLEDLNNKIYNAQRAMDKWDGDGSKRADFIKQEIKALQAEKAKLPPELLHEEKVNNATSGLKEAVYRLRKFPDIAINRQDVEKYMEIALMLGIPQAEVDAIVGDALEKKADQKPNLAPDETQKLLNQLTQNVKAYWDDLSFKAELDPSYTLPDDVLADIQSWDATNPDKPLNTAQNKVLRTIHDLREGQIAESDIHIAIRAGQH